MKEISSRVMRMIVATDRPDRVIDLYTNHPHSAEQAHFERLYDTIKGDAGVLEGNLEPTVMALSKDDIPAPTDDNRVILLAEYRRKLSRGETLYLITLVGYTYIDEFDDEMDPPKPEYLVLSRIPTNGLWVSIEEVCDLRDIDKSTVTRAIYACDLNCGLCEEDGRRYIRKDDLLEEWWPERKRSYLRDRRIIILLEILLNEDVYTLHDLYARVWQVEEGRFGGLHLPDDGLDAFFEETLEPCPQSLITWRVRAYEIAMSFGLDNERKLHRGLGDKRAA